MDRIEELRAEQKERQDERVRRYRGQLDVDGTTLLFQQLGDAEAALTEALDIAAIIKTDRAICREAIAEQERLLERATAEITQARHTLLEMTSATDVRWGPWQGPHVDAGTLRVQATLKRLNLFVQEMASTYASWHPK
jgi:hypothetical protein